jgi:hypothetical protein
MNCLKGLSILLVGLGFAHTLHAQTFPLQVKKGEITYVNDERGNRILDFSSCGYRSSNVPLPDVANVIFVSWQEGDNSGRIQRAIDYVSSLAPDAQGFRGAVLLDKGVFELTESLQIRTSGVVLRGMDREETVLLKKGVDRGALVYVEGLNDKYVTDTFKIETKYVPVNACTFQISGDASLKVGERVQILRPSTKEWIASLGCFEHGGANSYSGWKPGEIDILWDRTIMKVEGNQVTVDAPFTVALDEQWGTSLVMPYVWNGRISDAGVENMTLVSDYDKNYPMDEDHCWTGVFIDNAENCWVRRVNFKHFAGSSVVVQHAGSKVTVEDCMSTEPVSEIGGMRRCTFLTYGQQTLFQRCLSVHGIHDFSAGYCAAGPNAFVQCDSEESLGFSGSIDTWACGLLFDIVNIDGNDLMFRNLGQHKNGAGWNTSNSMFWQCTASMIHCFSPAKDAKNYTYGSWAQCWGDGEWAEMDNHVQPRSLFYAQLKERLNKDVETQARILPRSTNATSSPTVEQAMKLAAEAYEPRLTMNKWVQDAPYTASVSAVGLKNIDDIKQKKQKEVPVARPQIGVVDGKIVKDGQLLVGGSTVVPWWSGKLKTNWLPKAKPHITRFVPGREGWGLTDRIDSTINYMVKNHILVMDHNYGLWYDRRRDDHERVRRRDGDVWAPFYEQPFGRSGQGKAWEGLSKYDLNKPNAWYWQRMKEFAAKGEEHGLLLFHQNYFQHNILEAGAHWVDSPWRSTNNINGTDMPEPVNFAGDKRVFVADMFYDVNHPVRKELHRSYIRMCLEQFADHSNVVQLISAEYTGPLHFVQFWIDVIAEWEKETGKNALIALSATKDVQDAILNDPQRSKVVDIIDIRYWHYNTNELYAPEGGKNMAPRQHARKMKVGKVTLAEAYKAVSEYRRNYPDKAVTYYTQNYPEMSWAVFFAGGSCPVLPVKDVDLLNDAAKMLTNETDGTYWQMGKNGIGCIVCSLKGGNITLNLDPGRYVLKSVNMKTGEVKVLNKNLNIKGIYILDVLKEPDCIYWFDKK